MPRRPEQFRPYRPPRLARPTPARDEGKVERDAFYSSSAWMRLRLAFLAENPLCARCLERDLLTPATIAHHVEERLARPELAMDPENLEPICASCHSRHHRKARRSP